MKSFYIWNLNTPINVYAVLEKIKQIWYNISIIGIVCIKLNIRGHNMESNAKYYGYHSTSKENALEILSGGFRLPKMDVDGNDKDVDERFFEYWLGSGIYFYEDEDVAKWWNNKPSNTFGVEGDHMILKSEICPKNVFDLRKVSSWNKLIKFFDQFMKNFGKNVVVEEKDSKSLEHKIRCIFFSWLHSSIGCDMIIAAFNQSEFKYLDKGVYSIGEKMDIYYSEVQYCVYDASIINSTKKNKI